MYLRCREVRGCLTVRYRHPLHVGGSGDISSNTSAFDWSAVFTTKLVGVSYSCQSDSYTCQFLRLALMLKVSVKMIISLKKVLKHFVFVVINRPIHTFTQRIWNPVSKSLVTSKAPIVLNIAGPWTAKQCILWNVCAIIGPENGSILLCWIMMLMRFWNNWLSMLMWLPCDSQ